MVHKGIATDLFVGSVYLPDDMSTSLVHFSSRRMLDFAVFLQRHEWL